MNDTSKRLSAKAIFLAAQRVENSQTRQRFLEKECGTDVALREMVEVLLAARPAPGESPLDVIEGAFGPEPTGFPGEPLIASANSPQLREIGPYKLLEQIGEGGFGTVYMAEQTTPIKRKVALKILKPGMDSKEVIARFEAERQALAMMDHPNISRVIDGGTTAEGRLFFVMELVRGIPITEYCDEVRLTTNERLELFIDICRAVQHAHQKGIIHRDLKPSNVMITMHDDKAVVKVIDFGIAKALNQKLTDRTMFTGYQQLLGSPLYMSPEQAQMSGIDVDTRSDIYSLGVMLYELLTGTTPFAKETLSNAGFDELLRIIREQEPPRPSARVTTLDAKARSTMSDCRRIDHRRFSDELRGELDWIVMKALEKNRTRRYESASAFAADVQRYLNDEPVEACPPTVMYRVKKFTKRNKASMTTILSVFVVLALGIILASAQAVRAEREAKIAKSESERASSNLRVAIAAVNDMYTEFADSFLSQTRGAQELRRKTLEKALSFYEFLSTTNPDDSLKFEVATSWRRIGQIYHSFGEHDKSIDALRRASSQLELFSQQDPNEAAISRELAFSHWYISKPFEVTNRLHEGETSVRKAIAIQRRLVSEFPDNSDYRVELATSYHQLGHCLDNVERAIEAYEMSIAQFSKIQTGDKNQEYAKRQIAHDVTHLGELAATLGRTHEAEKYFRSSIELFETMQGSANADVVDSLPILLAKAHLKLGSLLRESGDLEGSLKHLNTSVQMSEQIVADFPSVTHYRLQLTSATLEHGRTLAALGKTLEAKDEITQLHQTLQQLAKKYPEQAEYTKLKNESAQELQRLEIAPKVRVHCTKIDGDLGC